MNSRSSKVRLVHYIRMEKGRFFVFCYSSIQGDISFSLKVCVLVYTLVYRDCWAFGDLVTWSVIFTFSPLVFRDRCSLLDFDEPLIESMALSAEEKRPPKATMTSYKTLRVHCKLFGLQTRLENLIIQHYRDMILAFHQQMWIWRHEWINLSLEQIQSMEKALSI